MAKSQFAIIYRNVPGLLVEMRLKTGMTQRELAAKVGKSQSWVFKSEAASRRIDIAEFLEWCIACDVSPSAALLRLMKLR